MAKLYDLVLGELGRRVLCRLGKGVGTVVVLALAAGFAGHASAASDANLSLLNLPAPASGEKAGGGTPAAPAFAVQLGAYGKPAGAERAWRRAASQASDLLKSRPHHVAEARVGGSDKPVFRLQTGPLDRTGAKDLCSALQAQGLDCFVVAFAGAPIERPPLLQPAAATIASKAEPKVVRTQQAQRTPVGRHAVQVGAYQGRSEAERAWRVVMAAAGDLLGELPRRTVEAQAGNKGWVFRLQTGAFNSRAAAGALCAMLKSRGVACFPVVRAASEDELVAARPAEPAPSQSFVVKPAPEVAPVVEAAPASEPVVAAPAPVKQAAPAAPQATEVASEAEPPRAEAKPKVPVVPLPGTRKAENFQPNDLNVNPVKTASSGLLYAAQGSARTGREDYSVTTTAPRRKRVQSAQAAKGEESSEADDVEEGIRLSDKPQPFLTEGDIPDRPPLLLELGDPFLDTGELRAGFELPTGAVWQPRLWVFGTLRTSVQTIDTGDAERISEWVNRLDLFANLQLTGTEKVVLGIRPLDGNRPDKFSGYRFEPEIDKGFKGNFNANVRTAFVEGDFGSLFPALDPKGTTLLDFGFTVGRQPLIFQDGILISDTIDAAGLVRNNIRLPGVSNLRIAGIYGWDGFDEVTRSAGGIGIIDDENLQLAGLFTQWDMPFGTVNLDGLYVWDDTRPEGDGIYAGISSAQTLGWINTTFRANGSLAQNDESVLVRDGILLSSELSWTPYGTNDTAYFNQFVAFGEFLQGARERIDGGGPLAPLGILFASPNIGDFGSEISNRANDVVGAAIGYQAFWDDNRRNLAVEIAVRHDLGLDDGADVTLDGFNQYAIGFQLQQKVGQRMLLQLEGFGALQEDRDEAYGGRAEVLYQF